MFPYVPTSTFQHTNTSSSVYYKFVATFPLLLAERLSNFKIGLTNINPEEKAPAVGIYEECVTVNELLGAGQKKLVACSGKGRYLVIQLIPKNYLTLCEVEVFGGM